jgi:hypothetical protein
MDRKPRRGSQPRQDVGEMQGVPVREVVNARDEFFRAVDRQLSSGMDAVSREPDLEDVDWRLPTPYGPFRATIGKARLPEIFWLILFAAVIFAGVCGTMYVFSDRLEHLSNGAPATHPKVPADPRRERIDKIDPLEQQTPNP